MRKPRGELRLHAGLLEHGLDLRPAAVDDDRIDARLLQQHDVAGKCARHRFVTHGVTAVFDDDGRIVVALHIGQGFREDMSDFVG